MRTAARLIPTETLAALLATLAALLAFASVTITPPSNTTQSVPAAQSGVVEAPPAPADPTHHVVPPAGGTTIPPQPTFTAPTTPAPPTATAPPPPPLPPGDGIAPAPPAIDPRVQQVLQLVNSERSRAGCGPVHLETRLSSAALVHSQDMAERNYFDHISPDGSSPADRVSEAGYDWSGTGENIASGYDTAQEVMDGWMSSEGHRKNILNCDWADMGIGIVDVGPDAPYWTQEFGTRPNGYDRSSDQPAGGNTWHRGQ